MTNAERGAAEKVAVEWLNTRHAVRAGECPGYINCIGLPMERVYCDRGALHSRHGDPEDDRHQADVGTGMVVFWR